MLIARAVGLFELGAAVLDATPGRKKCSYMRNTLFLKLQKPSDGAMTQKAALQSYRTTSEMFKVKRL